VPATERNWNTDIATRAVAMMAIDAITPRIFEDIRSRFITCAMAKSSPETRIPESTAQVLRIL
jgi:hypothetical protein